MSLQCVLSLAEVVKSPYRDQNYSILVQFHSNGTDSGIKCILSSFADDTQLSGAVDILVARDDTKFCSTLKLCTVVF